MGEAIWTYALGIVLSEPRSRSHRRQSRVRSSSTPLAGGHAMTDAIVQRVEGALSSPWGLLAVAAVAAVDGFFPVVPSESLVVAAGVFAAGRDQNLALVIAAAALGAFTGDHVSYAVR